MNVDRVKQWPGWTRMWGVGLGVLAAAGITLVLRDPTFLSMTIASLSTGLYLEWLFDPSGRTARPLLTDEDDGERERDGTMVDLMETNATVIAMIVGLRRGLLDAGISEDTADSIVINFTAEFFSH